MLQIVKALAVSTIMLGALADSQPAAAVSDEVDESMSKLTEIGVDPTNLAVFCGIIRQLGAAHEAEDEAKVEAEAAKMVEFLNGLGPRFVRAWELGEELDPESEDGQALEEAFGTLEEKCEE